MTRAVGKERRRGVDSRAWLVSLTLVCAAGCSAHLPVGQLDDGKTSGDGGDGGTVENGGDAGNTGAGNAGIGDHCGGSGPGCLAGLDCVDGGCLIPPHSPQFRCGGDADCERDPSGHAIICEERICCNHIGGPCADQIDCCTGFLCVNHACILETDHGYCVSPVDCASGLCGPGSFCDCLTDGMPATSFRQCCSGQLNAAGTACATSTLRASCGAGGCSPNTEACQGGSCCVTSIGSKIEPCSIDQDCCQSPVNLACVAHTCCNLLNGPCRSNDDCCVSNICNAAPGQTGLCKENSGTTVCAHDADCISASCAIATGACN